MSGFFERAELDRQKCLVFVAATKTPDLRIAMARIGDYLMAGDYSETEIAENRLRILAAEILRRERSGRPKDLRDGRTRKDRFRGLLGGYQAANAIRHLAPVPLSRSRRRQ